MSPTPVLPVPFSVRVLRAASALLLVVFALSTLLRPSGVSWAFFDVWVVNLCYASAVLLVVLRAVLSPVSRGAWVLLAASLVVWFSGDLYYSLAFIGVDEVPFPSVADALWLGFFPLAYSGLTMLIRAEAGRFRLSVWLDGLVGGLAAAAVAAVLAFDAILEATTGSAAAVATNLAYPAGDLVLLVLVGVALSSFSWRVSRSWASLTAGLVVFAAADTLYCWQIATDTYVLGSFLDALWPLGLLLMAHSAWQPAVPASLRLSSWATAFVPLSSMVAALGILTWSALQYRSNIGVYLSALALLAGLVRMTVTFQELRLLADSQRMARTDDLTGLPNRRGLSEHLSAVLQGGSGHLVLVDLDLFKEVNDTFGHPAGDDLLCLVGSRLSETLGPDVLVARLGGDEFAAVLPLDLPAARRSVDGVLAALVEPFDLGVGVRVKVGASAGLVGFPEHASDVYGLLQRADVALYHAKETRSASVVYDPSLHEKDLYRLRLVEELRCGIAAGQLRVFYQPKVVASSAELVGVEALVRWEHPERGLLPPSEFVDLAETSGLMPALTEWVTREAVSQAAAWHAAGRGVSVAVNLSASSLLDRSLCSWVSGLLSECALPAHLLVLEVTESVLVGDPAAAREVLVSLSDLGVKVAIDDFGTGYSSLAYLRDLPVDELKLDRSFILDIVENARSATLVSSTISLAHSLGFALVVEGVEDAASLELVASLGADLVQGFHISRPLPVGELERWAWSLPEIPSPREPSPVEVFVSAS